jgi:hypothetical protein
MKSMEEFEERLEKLEKREFEDTLTLVEILSTIAFFGGLKTKKCKYAKEGQCGLFFLESDAKKKTPIATDCRIKDCEGEPDHCHLELSNVTCAFCPEWLPNQHTKRDSE